MTQPRLAALPALDALDAANRAIAGLQPVDSVLQLIVDRVRTLVDAEYAALGIFDRRGRIERFVTAGIDDETRRRLGAPPEGHGLLGLIVRENRSIRIPDIAAHPSAYGFPEHHPRMTSLLGVPVPVEGRTVGNLYLTDKRGTPEFSDQDQEIVEAFARHAGIAIHNARLLEQVRGLTVVEERERIGRDIHDGIIQALYGIGLSLEDVPELMAEDSSEAVARVERAIDSIHVAIRDLRTFVFGLRPELVESSSLVGGLAALAEAFRHNTLIEPQVSWQPTVQEPSPEVVGELLSIASEALSNIARHARATAVTIDLRHDGTGLVLDIADNGIGLGDTEMRHPGHHGLDNMRERASHVGGRIDIASAEPNGTRVVVRIPDDTPAESPDR
ncbi:MAG TPA: GAF domain-containing sensor histidine kinase [Candidatus Limnocylindrales bacterium]|nr:GAF domain-containing sensor histidine kinase [Candidatus Limnocylindrales bacterium]